MSWYVFVRNTTDATLFYNDKGIDKGDNCHYLIFSNNTRLSQDPKDVCRVTSTVIPSLSSFCNQSHCCSHKYSVATTVCICYTLSSFHGELLYTNSLILLTYSCKYIRSYLSLNQTAPPDKVQSFTEQFKRKCLGLFSLLQAHK